MPKFKVLDLFAGSQSVKKALELCDFEYEYLGLDIVGKDNFKLDLSDKEQVKLWLKTTAFKPNFIWASPPCRTFSNILACKGGNFYYEVKKSLINKIKPRDKNPTTSIHKVFIANGLSKKGGEQIYQEARKGIEMVQNTLKIVRYFGSPFVIENPATSLMRHLLFRLPCVKTSYCVWGFDYRKDTKLWYSKQDLFNHRHWAYNYLPKCDHRQVHKKTIGTSQKYKGQKQGQKQISNYNERAKVPPQLIKFILEKEHKRWFKNEL